jgi:hypothetical protein
LDWHTKHDRIQENISSIFNKLNAFCRGTNDVELKKELSFNNDKFLIEIQNRDENKQKELNKQEEILLEINNNQGLKDKIYKMNTYINTLKEQAIIDELISPKSEENPSTLFLYLLEMPLKIFEFIIEKFH